MVDAALFSSVKEDWETPDYIFEPLKQEFQIYFDACATAYNTKCYAYCSPQRDGLKADWAKICRDGKVDSAWMNPPYGRTVTGKWVKKAYEESLKGITVVCLLPARTDTKWFHDYILGKAEIRFIKGRIKFVGAKYSAPFPSMIVIFRGKA